MSDSGETEIVIQQRAGGACELCGASEGLEVLTPAPLKAKDADYSLLACRGCRPQVAGGDLEPKHWFCLKESIWSAVPAVQGLSYRLLTRLQAEPWAVELLDQAYLEEDVLEWAKQGVDAEGSGPADAPTKDSNGTELQEGDTVTLIKALEVKGGNFTAKRGTTVKGIRLTDNPEHVEGRVNGMVIVLKTCFLKRL